EFCVSGHHAEVYRTGNGEYEVNDLGSTEGTFLNRKRLSAPAKIKDGDVLKFGVIEMAVQEYKQRKRMEQKTKVSKKNGGRRRKPASPKKKNSAPHNRLTDHLDEEGIIRFEEEPLAKGLKPSQPEVEEPEEELAESLGNLADKETDKKADAEDPWHPGAKVARPGIDEDSSAGEVNAELEPSTQFSEHEPIAKEPSEAPAESATEKQLQQEIEELKARLANSESLSGNIAGEQIEQTRPLEELQRRLEAAEKAGRDSVEREASLQQANSELTQQLENAQGRTSDLEARIKEGASSDSDAAVLINELKAQLKDSESQATFHAGLHDELERTQQKQQAAEAEIEDLQEKVILAEAEAQRFRDELTEAESQSITQGNLKDELESTREKQLAAEAEVNDLKEKLASIEAEVQQVREALDASQDQHSDIDVLLTAKSNLALEQAVTIDQLRKELLETKENFATTENRLLETHRGELEALKSELHTFEETSNQLKEQLESARSDLTSLQETSAREQTQQTLEHEAKLSKLEEDFAQSKELRSEIESTQGELKDQLRKREERISVLTELNEDLESRAKGAEEEKLRIAADLEVTREGLSGALHSTRRSLDRANQELEAEVVRRGKVEELLEKSEAARKGLRHEIEALQAGSDKEVVLSLEEDSLNRTPAPEEKAHDPESDLIKEKSDELLAFGARLASLQPNENNGVDGRGSFDEVGFFQQLLEKLDLIDEIVELYGKKRRYAKIVEQVSLLKESFLELLDNQSVERFLPEPGTALCMDQSNRLELVPNKDGSEPKIDPFGNTQVTETVSPGYIFHNGSRDLVIRKATVAVG
ncbi:MAG: FHA domain-containing protein, partial [Verrucomicrobiota bacterium]